MNENERQKFLQRKEEDLKFMQGCVCVVLAFILELVLFQIKDRYINFTVTPEGVAQAELIYSMLKTGRIISGGLILVAVAWIVGVLSSGAKSLFPPIALLCTGLVTLACWHGTLVYSDKGLDMLLLLVPAWAGLGLVYFLYQIEFFISALFVSLGGVGLWLFRQISLYTGDVVLENGEVISISASQMTFYVFVNASLLVVIAVFLLVNRACKTDGILQVKEHKITLVSDMKDSSSLWLVGLSGVLSFLALAISMGLGSPMVAYYSTFLLIGWLFVLLVYFTVKLM